MSVSKQCEIQAAGRRTLTAVEPAPLSARLMPTLGAAGVEIGAELLAEAQTMRITTPHGTEVTYRLGVYPTMSEYGYTDQPGRWDHWPTAFVLTGGRGGDGTIVLAPGDVLLPFDTYVQTPVHITIEQGFIRDIRGGLDAELLSSYIRSVDDQRGYGMNHVGWGLRRARAGTASPGSAAAWAWSCAVSTATSCSRSAQLGGPSDTPYHFDIPMRGCSPYLDDELIVDAGELTVPEVRPAGRR